MCSTRKSTYVSRLGKRRQGEDYKLLDHTFARMMADGIQPIIRYYRKIDD